MKVASKLALAFGLHSALLGGVLIHHVGSIRDAVSTGYDLTELSSRIYITATEQLGRVAQLEENAAKFWVTRDEGYLHKFQELFQAHNTQLRQLARMSLSPREREELSAIEREWTPLATLAPRLADLVLGSEPDVAGDSLLLLQERLDGLRLRTQRMSEASQTVMLARLEESARAAREAERLSWMAAAIALVLSVLISTVIVRSISDSLRRLKRGAREVAEGRFGYRLDTSRDDEFAQLAHDFNTMTERLGELDRMKRDFLSKISHDLKTPLASMQETIDVLLDEVPGPLAEKQRRLLQLNHQSGQRLSGMLAKLLDLSQLESGTLQPELRTLELSGVVRRALDQCESLCVERALRLVPLLPDASLLLECDGDRLLQLLENLLENAVKFSPLHGEIRVEMRLLETRPRDVPPQHWRTSAQPGSCSVLITVQDAGPGVPPAHRELIFEPFYQTETGRSVRGRGVGLGLTICRDIAAAHGGAIWIADTPGGGSRFHVLLPGGIPIASETPLAAEVPSYSL